MFSRFLTLSFILISTGAICGCATTWMLPQAAAGVNFDEDKQKGWLSSYEKTEIFKDVELETIYKAAESAIVKNGFKIRIIDSEAAVIIAEHPITWLDWNSMMGVYWKKDGNDILVKVMVEGAKDSVIDITGHQQNYMYKVLGDIALNVADAKKRNKSTSALSAGKKKY